MRQIWATLPARFKLLLLTMVIANIGSAVFMPFLALYIRDLRASVAEVGLTYGLFSTTMSLIAMPAPAIGAQLWQNVSPRLPFYVTAAVGLVMAIPIWLKFKPPVQDETPAMAALK